MTSTFTPRFRPVPVRARRDGWTPARQAAFIEALGRTRCVAVACRAVGLSSQSAYTLYRRADAQDFRAAWDDALRWTPLPTPPRAANRCRPAEGVSASTSSTTRH